jgi:hypothetical protein
MGNGEIRVKIKHIRVLQDIKNLLSAVVTTTVRVIFVDNDIPVSSFGRFVLALVSNVALLSKRAHNNYHELSHIKGSNVITHQRTHLVAMVTILGSAVTPATSAANIVHNAPRSNVLNHLVVVSISVANHKSVVKRRQTTEQNFTLQHTSIALEQPAW